MCRLSDNQRKSVNMLMRMPKLIKIYHNNQLALYRQTIRVGFRVKCSSCNNDAKFKYYTQGRITQDGHILIPILGKYCSIDCMRIKSIVIPFINRKRQIQ